MGCLRAALEKKKRQLEKKGVKESVSSPSEYN